MIDLFEKQKEIHKAFKHAKKKPFSNQPAEEITIPIYMDEERMSFQTRMKSLWNWGVILMTGVVGISIFHIMMLFESGRF